MTLKLQLEHDVVLVGTCSCGLAQCLPLGPYFQMKGHQRNNLWATSGKLGGKKLLDDYVTAWIEEVHA